MKKNKFLSKKYSYPLIFTSVLILSACGAEPDSDSDSLSSDSDTKLAYVERNTDTVNTINEYRFANAVDNEFDSPLSFFTPYEYNPGARLLIRSGLDVDAQAQEVLSSYFGSSVYDVKDLNVSADGEKLLFAARGADDHPTDPKWNIFEYDFMEASLRRAIADDAIANIGHDTNPAYTQEEAIIFSSDRSSNPNGLFPNKLKVSEYCYQYGPVENPSLLHSMTGTGEDITQLTFGNHHDTHPTTLKDGRIAFIRHTYSYSEASNHTLAKSTSAMNELFTPSHQAPKGLNKSANWSANTAIHYALNTAADGQGKGILFDNAYTLLRLDPTDNSLDQLYKTVELTQSDDQFLFMDRIVQAENGRLLGTLKRQYNNTSSNGGAIVDLKSPTQTNGDTNFGEFAVKLFGEINFGPNQQSKGGWYSAIWPYRDGTSRVLASWTQCLTNDGEVSDLCKADAIGNIENVEYGVWVVDEAGRKSEIIPVSRNKIYDNIALNRVHTGIDYPFAPYQSPFVDNADERHVVCDYPEPNNAPIANAGADQAVYVNSIVYLDGSASSDADGDLLTYNWTLTDKPAGSAATLSGADTATPQLTADQAGNYQVSLVVNDGTDNSAPSTVLVVASVEVINTAPKADAGDDQSVIVSTLVTLDGTNSADTENDPLSYQWTLISGPSGVDSSILADTSSATPTFTPIIVGNYNFQLIVNDGQLSSAPDTVLISAAAANRAPTAEAGVNQQVEKDDTITLDGSASFDPDGDPLNYRWTLLEPAGTTLNNANTISPSLTIQEYGTYRIQLIVNDGNLDSAPDTVSLSASNAKPVANAGDDINLDWPVADVTLDGTASYDPNGDPLTYRWSVLAVPTGSTSNLTNSTAASPTLVVDMAGEYKLQLIVNDGLLDSDPSEVIVSLNENVNTAPVADAGDPQEVEMGATVDLDGSGSSDADGDPLTYQWSVLSPDGAVLSDPTSISPSISISTTNTYTIQLIVNDGQADSAPDTVNLQVGNVKPVADAGPDQSVTMGDAVTLDGSASTDMDGDSLTYQWQIIEQPVSSTAVLDNAQALMPVFTADEQGSYVIQLVVNDGTIDSDPDSVVINTIPLNTIPVADAGDDTTTYLGGSVNLDGTGSRDADGDPLTYQWNLLSKPTSASASLSNSTSANPQLQGIDIHGDYVAQLVVNDGTDDSAPDTVIISTQNLAPIADAGTDLHLDPNQSILLDGSNSSDPENATLSYSWSLISSPNGSNPQLSNTSTATPGFTSDTTGVYVAQLIVNDGLLNSTPDTVTIEVNAVACLINTATTRTFPVTIRDFQISHEDFEIPISDVGLDYGIVREDLGEDNLPVYIYAGDPDPYRATQTTHGHAWFESWYRTTDGINLEIPMNLTMTRESNSATWEFRDNEFFPIDDDALPAGVTSYGNTPIAVAQGWDHNFHFTLETHLEFDYNGGESFTFTGDDDLWVFINGKRAIDIGGVHSAESQSVNLDDIADYLGIEKGKRYAFDLFFAERHLSASNFVFQTSINLDCLPEQ